MKGDTTLLSEFPIFRLPVSIVRTHPVWKNRQGRSIGVMMESFWSIRRRRAAERSLLRAVHMERCSGMAKFKLCRNARCARTCLIVAGSNRVALRHVLPEHYRALKLDEEELKARIEEEGLENYHPERGTRPHVYYRNLHLFSREFIAAVLRPESGQG